MIFPDEKNNIRTGTLLRDNAPVSSAASNNNSSIRINNNIPTQAVSNPTLAPPSYSLPISTKSSSIHPPPPPPHAPPISNNSSTEKNIVSNLEKNKENSFQLPVSTPTSIANSDSMKSSKTSFPDTILPANSSTSANSLISHDTQSQDLATRSDPANPIDNAAPVVVSNETADGNSEENRILSNTISSVNATIGSDQPMETGAVPKTVLKRALPDNSVYSIDFNHKKLMKEKEKLVKNNSYLNGLKDEANFTRASEYTELDRPSQSEDAVNNSNFNTVPQNATNSSLRVQKGDPGSDVSTLNSSNGNDKLYDSKLSPNSSNIFEDGRQIIDHNMPLDNTQSTDGSFDTTMVAAANNSHDLTPLANQSKLGAKSIFQDTTVPVNLQPTSSILDASTQPVLGLSDDNSVETEAEVEAEKTSDSYMPSLSSIFKKKPTNDDDDDYDDEGRLVINKPATSESWLDSSSYLAPHNNATNTSFSIPKRREIFTPRFNSTRNLKARKRSSPLGTEGIQKDKHVRIGVGDEDTGFWL